MLAVAALLIGSCGFAFAASEEGGDAHEGHGVSEFWRFTDLFALIAIFVGLNYYYRNPFGRFLKERSQKIRGELDQCRSELDSATMRYKEVSEKLEGLEKELSRLLDEGDLLAQKEEKRLMAETEEQIAKMADATRRRMATDIANALKEERVALVDAAVLRAESRLQKLISRKADSKIISETLSRMDA